ncbi:MAG: hypothetical protein IH784_06790 [Bacteroidetes bacterium]|nr:hypothetical protein [Bacteroidota bacterium]
MPTCKGWSLQLEYNIWVAERDLRADLYAPEWAMLVAYKWNIKRTYIRMLGGIGGISSGESWFGGNRDFLFSFNIALNVGFNFSKHISGFLQIRHQRAAELNAGSGIEFTPWLLGVGFEFDFSDPAVTFFENSPFLLLLTVSLLRSLVYAVQL